MARKRKSPNLHDLNLAWVKSDVSLAFQFSKRTGLFKNESFQMHCVLGKIKVSSFWSAAQKGILFYK